jgi:hypothetical protein
MVMGASGAGKSTLLRTLVPDIPGPKVFVAYQYVELPPGAVPSPNSEPPPVPMLLVDPALAGVPAEPSPGRWAPSSLAMAPQESGSVPAEEPPALTRSVRRLIEAGAGTLVVDSWDHGSNEFFRSQAPGPECVRTITAPGSAIAGMQSSLVTNPLRVLIAVALEVGQPMISMADAVVELREEVHEGGRVRVVSVPKARGAAGPPLRPRLYTLEGGRFRSFAPLPATFRPPVSPPDPDVEPTAGALWPGSASFARTFGRLRHGGVTIMGLSADCPETVPHALSLPLVIHALREKGRVVWIPAPSMRPAQIVSELKEQVPDELMRDQLRILSAGGDDPSLGDLRSVVLPLRRESVGGKRPSREEINARDGRFFPDIYRFLRDRPGPTDAVLVIALEGLWAAALEMGLEINRSLVPVELGFYTRLPRSHILAFGNAADPIIPHVRPAVDTLLHLEFVHGRPVVFGIRPRTSAYVLDWPTSDGRFELVPVE